ncbi:MAG: histidine--tRNA ligase [Balneola sp.]|jgi:histidyl-tRNA synthetase|nr:histidine--tRNA ligase [Balneola sp.]MAO78657.1 histidine--tRNA ligase [Balneola sp.]MBF63115.1 histidine--tRNA ligase [Balneola sp.]|tara:strand:- start:23753 stop:25009 length:1257 start_codon:yes stop_codon:yes gene_type:complete
MAKAKYTTHLGMVDILPDESPKWRALENIIHEEAANFNFEEIRTPIMEQTELIKRGIGQLTDIVTKEIFAFTKGDSNYVLRPELTAPVVRAYVQHHLDQRGGSQKLYYIGPMFRAERPQKGRQRQFHQFGVEVIGSENPVADVECIAFMMRIYQRIGIKNFNLKLNSVGDPESRENYKSVLKEYLEPHLEKLSELSQKRFDTNPMRILDSKEPEDQEFIQSAPVISDHLNEESKEHFAQVCEMLSSLNIEYTLDPLLVRGMDYYTRTAFELTSPDLGSQDALAGGGRYDLLVEEIGGKPTPAVGFAAGMERLFIACEELGISLADEKKVDVFIVSLGEQARKWALKTLPIFRENGISATMDYLDRSMRAQMKDANRENATYALIVGDNELEEGKFTLRNMKESEESVLDLASIIEKIN